MPRASTASRIEIAPARTRYDYELRPAATESARRWRRGGGPSRRHIVADEIAPVRSGVSPRVPPRVPPRVSPRVSPRVPPRVSPRVSPRVQRTQTLFLTKKTRKKTRNKKNRSRSPDKVMIKTIVRMVLYTTNFIFDNKKTKKKRGKKCRI